MSHSVAQSEAAWPAGGWTQPKRWPGALALASLRRSPVGLSGTALVILFIAVALFADGLSPRDPNLANLRVRFQPPAWAEGTDPNAWLGTDQTGRDILSRIIKGSQVSVVVGVSSVAVAGVIGVLFGLAAGFFGGLVDNLIMRVTDAFLAIPFIVLVVAVSGVVGPGLVTLILILGCTGWVTYTRVIRGEVLALREREFVTAARVVGQAEWVILLRHVLPNVMSSVIVLATLQVATTILAETSLSFLGLGLRPPAISWGVLIQQAQNVQAVALTPWLLIPALPVIIAVLAFNFLGDGLRDAADPYAQLTH